MSDDKRIFEITVTHTYEVSLSDLEENYETSDWQRGLELDLDNARTFGFEDCVRDGDGLKYSGRVLKIPEVPEIEDV